MNIEFVSQRIDIAVGPRRGEVGPQTHTVDGIVGVGTDMACYAVPDGTFLERKFPGAWLVSHKNREWRADKDTYAHCIPTNPLPADAETATILLSELHNKQICVQADAQNVILAMETAGIGRWVWISPEHKTKC